MKKRVRKEWTVVELLGWADGPRVYISVRCGHAEGRTSFGRMTREEADAMAKLMEASQVEEEEL